MFQETLFVDIFVQFNYSLMLSYLSFRSLIPGLAFIVDVTFRFTELAFSNSSLFSVRVATTTFLTSNLCADLHPKPAPSFQGRRRDSNSKNDEVTCSF